jgi:pimeloyl-ACP methyl ester carboxylesterase
MEALPEVKSPTLLIVGELDTPVIDMNRRAREQMDKNLQTELRIVRGATHLFEEPGALEQVAEMAREWFRRFLTDRSGQGQS